MWLSSAKAFSNPASLSENSKQSHERHPHSEPAAMGGVKPEEYLWNHAARELLCVLTCPYSNVCEWDGLYMLSAMAWRRAWAGSLTACSYHDTTTRTYLRSLHGGYSNIEGRL